MKSIYCVILLGLFFSSILSCGGGSSTSSPDFGISSQNCGNGSIDAAESCDDGNANNSDGCNSNCAWEVGQAICGNGVKENEECCDDGNNLSGDGCSTVCTSEQNNRAPTAPQLSLEPANGVTWAPTRLYLSWEASTDPDAGDRIVYDVYFVEGNGISPNAVPYKKGISDTHFIVQASTDNRAEYFPDVVSPIYLEAEQTYTWKVCARDEVGAQTCGESRIFNTDNSVVGWWRFDENPVGMVCPGILGGPAGDAGETVCDYSGFGNHGRPNGNPMWLAPDPMLLGGALAFDGVNDWVEVENNETLNFHDTEPISIGVSFNVNSIDNMLYGGILLSKDLPNDHGNYSMILREGVTVEFSYASPSERTNATYRSMPSLSVGSVSNIVYSYIYGSTLSATLYLNGALIPGSWVFGVGSGPVLFNDSPLKFGKRNVPDTSYYNGLIDEVIIYNSRLNNIIIANNYATH